MDKIDNAAVSFAHISYQVYHEIVFLSHAFKYMRRHWYIVT